MQRRRFLRRAIAAIDSLAGAAVPGLGTAQPLARRPAPILLQHGPLAGYQYHAGPTLWPRLAVGEPISLVREPQKRWDPRAVRLDWHGQKLGCMSRRDNAAVAQLLDPGQCLSARTRWLRDATNPWGRIELDIFPDL